MTEKLDRLRARIRALLDKTVERGCTEAEALAAAELAQRLMAEHGLTAEDVEGTALGMSPVETGRRRARPIDDLWPAVGACCDCIVHLRHGAALSVVYFGRLCDRLVAEYLHVVCLRAVQGALAEFQASPVYRRRRKPATRAAASDAFVRAMVAVLCRKLREKARARPGHQALLDGLERERAGHVALRDIITRRRPIRARFGDAALDGAIAGRDVRLDDGVGAGGPAALIGGRG